MAAFYNELDPNAAEWLRNLIVMGEIADGIVDERDIRDISPDDLAEFSQCHFFAGIGTWSYALRRAGWPDDREVWTGSCPCQPFSVAGMGDGFDDKRHLWPFFHHLIAQCRPRVVFGEQVASRDGLAWLDLVHADMEGSGYAFGAVDICAAGVGAPHIRQRLYLVADDDDQGLPAREPEDLSRAGRGCEGRAALQPCATNGFWNPADWIACRDGKARPTEPGTLPLAHGAPARVVRLRAYGNAIVAPLAEAFIKAYLDATS